MQNIVHSIIVPIIMSISEHIEPSENLPTRFSNIPIATSCVHKKASVCLPIHTKQIHFHRVQRN